MKSEPTAEGILGPEGMIARMLPGYEFRPQQMEMAAAVASGLAGQRHVIVEAGTGVGKSFAYLAPAIAKAVTDGGRVVISTHTIALQEQLMHKDIPFLQSLFPGQVSAVLVKGRGNYLGLRRLQRASRRQGDLLSGEKDMRELRSIEEWSRGTTDGSLADLPQAPSAMLWDRVRSEADDCQGRQCPTYQSCFFQKARRRAGAAHLLIVNHALLLSDLAIRRQGASLLPDYEYLIVDEAHTLESAAADHMGVSIGENQLRYLLNLLHHERTGRGALTPGNGESLVRDVQQVRSQLSEYFGALTLWFRRERRPGGRVRRPPAIAEGVSAALSSLASRLREVREGLMDEQDRLEFAALSDRCQMQAECVRQWHQQSTEEWVYWIEPGEEGAGRTTLRAAPIDVGAELRERLFSKLKSAVLTSATLAVGNDATFAYLRERLGVEDADTLLLGSPFDYANQARVYVETGLPDPDDKDAFVTAACKAVERYLKMTDGRAFVLFTSYEMLRQSAAVLRPRLAKLQMPVWEQGAGMPRSLLLEKFRSVPRSVLLGTDTFWTGVDVPGDALGNVIVVKLPFASPGNPRIEARVERIRGRGGNPFVEFQLPEAILKFRQGVGRLIRSKTDRGIIVILDPRVTRRSYGKQFLDSLPSCPVEFVMADDDVD